MIQFHWSIGLASRRNERTPYLLLGNATIQFFGNDPSAAVKLFLLLRNFVSLLLGDG